MNTYGILTFCLMLFFTNCLKFSTKVIRKRVDRPIPNSIQYFLVDEQNREISPWSDIDIKLQGDILNAVIEIPRQSAAKMQMIKQIPNHPLMQDIRTNKLNNKIQLRHYAIPLPLVSYGYIPQTWQQNIKPDASGYYGDNDPIDILDLSQKDRKIMDISPLKILGAFCLIDEGQLDWKVIAIDPQEARIKKINSYKDISQERINDIVNWFKIYKTYDGKPENTIGFNQKIFTKEETLQIIYDTHIEFIKLKDGKTPEYQERKDEFYL